MRRSQSTIPSPPTQPDMSSWVARFATEHGDERAPTLRGVQSSFGAHIGAFHDRLPAHDLTLDQCAERRGRIGRGLRSFRLEARLEILRRERAIDLAISRARMSVEPPGVNGTMRRIGRDGQFVSPRALVAVNATAIEAALHANA